MSAPNGTTAYVWDFENRLTSVTLPNGSVDRFKYDPFGRRIESDGTGRIFVYDGDNVIEDLDLTGKPVARYTQGLGIDEPLEVSQSGVPNYYEADGLGSITSVSTPTGTAANTYTYDSFGNVTATTGAVSNRFFFTAREDVAKAGLYYYRARYYDPGIGRFLSEDPDRFGAGIDFYPYVANNPASWQDPWGLKVFKCCRDIEVNWFINGVSTALRLKHCFIKTDTKEAGMGAARGEGLPSSPCLGHTQSAIRDHTGQAVKADCKEVTGVDEGCVNQELQIGKPTGVWSSDNNCNTFVDQVLEKCKDKGSCPLMKVKRPPFFIPILVM